MEKPTAMPHPQVVHQTEEQAAAFVAVVGEQHDGNQHRLQHNTWHQAACHKLRYTNGISRLQTDLDISSL